MEQKTEDWPLYFSINFILKNQNHDLIYRLLEIFDIARQMDVYWQKHLVDHKNHIILLKEEIKKYVV